MRRDQSEMVQQFHEMLSAERGASENTIDAYRRDLAEFLDHLLGEGKKFDTIGPQDIESYQEWSNPRLDRTRNRRRGLDGRTPASP